MQVAEVELKDARKWEMERATEPDVASIRTSVNVCGDRCCGSLGQGGARAEGQGGELRAGAQGDGLILPRRFPRKGAASLSGDI